MKDELRGKQLAKAHPSIVSLCATGETLRNQGVSLHLDKILRVIRTLAGTVILLTIVSAILIPQVLPVSGNSFINARLEWIRTPIDGDLSLENLKIGDSIEKGALIGKITNERIDDYFLNQLKSEKSGIDSALLSLEKRKEQLEIRSEELNRKVRESLLSFEETTMLQLSVANNQLTRTIQEKSTVTGQIRRYVKANEDYEGEESYAVVSRAVLEQLVSREKELITNVSSLEQDIAFLTTKLDSVLAGNFISDNTPVEQLQLIDIEQQLVNVESEIELLVLRKKEIASRVNTRIEALEKNNHYELVAGVAGTVWDIGFPDGSYVGSGDSVVAIADTTSLSVEGKFHQRYLDNIEIGDPVTIDLMGSTENLRGIVSDVKIRDQIKSADLTAINPGSPETNEFNVVVEIDKRDARGLYIGQRTKLIISKSASSIVPSILLFFD